MIDYAKTKKGDILRVVGAGAPGYVALGDLVRVKDVQMNSVLVENEKGEECKFVFNCGAARLEVTEWREDFPAPRSKPTVEELDKLLNSKDDRPVEILPDGSIRELEKKPDPNVT
jgi:hypothetical protein